MLRYFGQQRRNDGEGLRTPKALSLTRDKGKSTHHERRGGNGVFFCVTVEMGLGMEYTHTPRSDLSDLLKHVQVCWHHAASSLCRVHLTHQAVDTLSLHNRLSCLIRPAVRQQHLKGPIPKIQMKRQVSRN